MKRRRAPGPIAEAGPFTPKGDPPSVNRQRLVEASQGRLTGFGRTLTAQRIDATRREATGPAKVSVDTSVLRVPNRPPKRPA